MRVLARGGLQRGHDHVLDLVQQDRRRPARPRLIMQALQPPGDEPGPPPLHGRLIHPQISGGLLVRPALRAAQHDLRPQRQELGGLRPPGPRRSAGPAPPPPGPARALRRPTGAASSSPASRSAANWRRHFDTDLTATPSACAAPAFDIPSAHAKMIRARSARQRPGTPRPAHQLSPLILRQHDRHSRRTRHNRRLAASKHNPQNFRRDTLASCSQVAAGGDRWLLMAVRGHLGGTRPQCVGRGSPVAQCMLRTTVRFSPCHRRSSHTVATAVTTVATLDDDPRAGWQESAGFRAGAHPRRAPPPRPRTQAAMANDDAGFAVPSNDGTPNGRSFRWRFVSETFVRVGGTVGYLPVPPAST